jgi:hypothetical protein
MKSLLKTATVRIESLDRDLEISELCAKDQIALLEYWRSIKGDHGEDEPLNFDGHFIVCKYGVPEWRDETTEDLSLNLPLKAATEIANAIYKLSGIEDSKNSESVPSEDSSTVSPLN